MSRKLATLILAGLTIVGCNESQPQRSNNPQIKVRAAEQDQLFQLDAVGLAIGLKRAIYDAGYTCKRVTDAGFGGAYKNLDMWVAHCVYENGTPRDWAIFAGPDGSAQVRDCKDVAATGLPGCAIKQRPKGSFSAVK